MNKESLNLLQVVYLEIRLLNINLKSRNCFINNLEGCVSCKIKSSFP